MVSSLIFQKFSGEGLIEPPPQTPPPTFSRASPSVRASPSILKRYRALDSGFALDTRALRDLDSDFALNYRLGTLVRPPQNTVTGSAPSASAVFPSWIHVLWYVVGQSSR